MLADLLPRSVRVDDVVGEPGGGYLLPAEEAALGRVGDRRRREFTTARTCARRAAAALGLPAAPLLPGPDRAPRWPPGVVGSLTHCAGYTAAALARGHDLAALGIDAEPCGPLPTGVLGKVADARERARVTGLPPDAGVPWDTVLFSAKESVYKAWYPLTGDRLTFADADVEIHPRGWFLARLRVAGVRIGGRRVRTLPGRFAVRAGFVLTAVAVPAGARRRPAPPRTGPTPTTAPPTGPPPVGPPPAVPPTRPLEEEEEGPWSTPSRRGTTGPPAAWRTTAS